MITSSKEILIATLQKVVDEWQNEIDEGNIYDEIEQQERAIEEVKKIIKQLKA